MIRGTVRGELCYLRLSMDCTSWLPARPLLASGFRAPSTGQWALAGMRKGCRAGGWGHVLRPCRRSLGRPFRGLPGPVPINRLSGS